MDNLTFRELNLNDEKDIIDYEKALYRAFATDRKIGCDNMRNYDHKQKRCRTIIPYTNQYILIAQLNNKIIAASCFNISIAEGNNTKTGEMLHVFNNGGQIGLNALQKMREILLEKGKSEGITQVYANCFNERFGSPLGESSNITLEKVQLI